MFRENHEFENLGDGGLCLRGILGVCQLARTHLLALAWDLLAPCRWTTFADADRDGDWRMGVVRDCVGECPLQRLVAARGRECACFW